jgi:hypothetical protein
VSISEWVFVPVFMVFIVSFSLLLMVGAAVARPTQWNQAIYAAGLHEIERRLVGLGPRSHAELYAADRLIGPEPSDTGVEDAELILDAVLLLTDASDRAATEAELSVMRAILQDSAVRRQVNLVARMPSLRLASLLWRGGKLLSECLFAFVGFRWFFPRSLPFLGRRLQKHGGVLGVVGIVLGMIWAWITRLTGPADAPFDWLSIVGSVVTATLILGVIVAILTLYKVLLTTRNGQPAVWTPQGVLAGAFILGTVVAMETLVLSGVFTEWQQSLMLWAKHIDFSHAVGRWAVAGLLVALFGYVIVNVIKKLRNRSMYLSARLGFLVFLPVFVLAPVAVIIYALGLPFDVLDGLLLPAGYLMLGIACVAAAVAAIEWVKKLRTLTAHGVRVPMKGFRWWEQVAWLVTGIVLNALTPLMTTSSAYTWDNAWYVVLGIAWNLLSALWALAFFPLVIIAALYVRRVARTYDRLRFRYAAPHPNAPDDA